MQANELLIKLKYLTLAGYEVGNYMWIGTQEQWNKVKQEEINILTK